MKLSEQALMECRTATIMGSPMVRINEAALDYLKEELRPQFESVLDNAGGSSKWKHDRPQMLAQSALVGALAAFITKMADPRAREVPRSYLLAAFYFVKAVCDVHQKPSSPQTIYCQGVSVPKNNLRTKFWKQTFAKRA